MESNGWVMFNGDMTNDPWFQTHLHLLFLFDLREVLDVLGGSHGHQKEHESVASLSWLFTSCSMSSMSSTPSSSISWLFACEWRASARAATALPSKRAKVMAVAVSAAPWAQRLDSSRRGACRSTAKSKALFPREFLRSSRAPSNTWCPMSYTWRRPRSGSWLGRGWKQPWSGTCRRGTWCVLEICQKNIKYSMIVIISYYILLVSGGIKSLWNLHYFLVTTKSDIVDLPMGKSWENPPSPPEIPA